MKKTNLENELIMKHASRISISPPLNKLSLKKAPNQRESKTNKPQGANSRIYGIHQNINRGC